MTAPEVSWTRLAPILSVHFLGTLGFSLAIPFLVFVVTDLGGAPWTYGVVGATYSAFQLVGAPVLGRWSDRWGRRPVLVLSQAGTLAAWLLFLVALSMRPEALGSIAGATLTVPLFLVFVARALDGVTGGNLSVANAYVADVTVGLGEDRQIAFGRMGMAASLGFVLGPAMAGLLGATSWGYRAPVAAAAAFAFAATVAVIALLREPPARCPVGPPPQSALERSLHQQAKRCDRPPPPLSGALRDPGVVAVLVGTFLIFLAFNVFYAAFPVHAGTTLGWSPATLGWFYAVVSGVMIAAQGPLLTLASARLSRRLVFVIGILGLAGAFLCFTRASDAWIFAGAVLFAVGNGLSWPMFQARIAAVGGDEHQGAVQGAATSAGSLASIVGLVAGAAVLPALGSSVFLVTAVVFGLVAVLTPVWFGRPA